eukprot:gene9389-23122_t
MTISLEKTVQLLFTLNTRIKNGRDANVYVSKQEINFKPPPRRGRRRSPGRGQPSCTSGLAFEECGRSVLKDLQNVNGQSLTKLRQVLGKVLTHCNGEPVRAEQDWLQIAREYVGDLCLRFAVPHVSYTKQRMQKKNKLLRRLAGTDWGADRGLLRQLHQGCGQATADFASGVYSSFASAKQRSRLEVEQRRAACIISGCISTTPHHAALREAELLPLELRARQRAGTMLERFRRLPRHLQTSTLTGPAPNETRINWGGADASVRGCWRSAARAVVREAGTADLPGEELLIATLRPPWAWTATPSFHTNLFRPIRRWESKAVRQQAALETLAMGPRADIYGGTENGGSGWFFMTPEGVPLLKGKCAAGKVCSSFRAECIGLRDALRDLRRVLLLPRSRRPHLQLALEQLGVDLCLGATMGPTVQVLTDSLSAVRRLQRGPIAQRERIGQQIWDEIEGLWRICKVQVTFRWIPSHCNENPEDEGNLLWTNTVADRAAAEGGRLPQRRQPVDLKSAAA